MTVCIAATSAKKKAVVVASDRMLSAHFLHLEFDHLNAKIDILGDSCVGLSAGDALPIGELFGAAYGVSTQLQNPQIGQIAERIKEAYIDLRKRRVEEQYFRPRGITIDEFYQNGLIRQFPTEVAMSLDDMVRRANFGVELIVAGVDGNGAHIFGIADPGIAASYDRVGYHAIGSGMSHALLGLVSANQHWANNINQTVFNVYCAKRQAEAAPGVGDAIDMRIVTRDGCRPLDEPQLSTLEETRKKVFEPQLAQTHELISQLSFEETQADVQDAAAQ